MVKNNLRRDFIIPRVHSFEMIRIRIIDPSSLVFDGNFPSTSPREAYSWSSDLTKGFFALPFWGAYICRGLYMEGLIFRILRHLRSLILIQIIPKKCTLRIAKLTDAMTSLDSMT